MHAWCLFSGILCCSGLLSFLNTAKNLQQPTETRYWVGIITVRPGENSEQSKADLGDGLADSESQAAGYTMPPLPLVVRRVMVDSPAVRAGILPGDVLLELNQVQLRSHADLVAAIQANGDGAASLRLSRGGQLKSVELRPILRPADYVERVLRDREMESAEAEGSQAASDSVANALPGKLADLLAMAAQHEVAGDADAALSAGSMDAQGGANAVVEVQEEGGRNANSGDSEFPAQNEVNFDRSTRLLIEKLDEFAAEWSALLKRQQQSLRELSGQF